MKNNSKKKSKFKLMFIMYAIAIMGIVTVYTWFSQKRIEEYARYTVEQNAGEIANEVEVYLNSGFSSIQLTSQLVTNSMSDDNLNNYSDVLNLVTEESSFDFIEYIDKDGINHTDRGEWFDASNRDYYIEGMKGNTGIWVNYYPRYSTEILLSYYTPLYYKGEIVGVITGARSADTNLLPMLETNFFGEDMIGMLLDDKGQIISISDSEADKESYLDAILHGYGISNEGIRVFNNHLRKGDESAFEFRGNEGKLIACICTNDTTGWKVIQIVPHDSFKKVMRQNIVSAYYVIGAIICFVVIILLYLRNDYGNRHKAIITANNKIVRDYDQILTATASDTIKGIRRIDIETGIADYLYFDNHRIEQKDIGDWTAWVEGQKKYICKDDIEKLNKFSCMENLREMKEGVTYSISYKVEIKNDQGYNKTYTTNASVICVDGRKIAILATIDNTDVVVSELEQRRLLASAASIYISMHCVDLKNDVIETLNSADYIDSIVGERKNNVQDIINDAMLKLTDEQYLARMMEFIDFRTLNERMQGVKTITLEFLGRVSGWCRARFIAVDYDQNGNLSRVMWVIENIDAEKRKANRLLYLSETDLMTGIRNRGSGELKIKEHIAEAAKGLFFLFDVDKFKSINDNYGHKTGDKVLIAIAESLKESFRDSDVVMRLGGDEFGAFAVGIDTEEQAVPIIDRLFSKIEYIDIPELGNRRVTVSLGVAATSENIEFDTLYKNADSCTYESKKVDGNSYTFYKAAL